MEIHKTLRWLILCLLLGFGFWCLTKAVGVVASESPWKTIGIALVACLFGPSGVIFILIKSRKRAINKHHRRIVELEETLSPTRSSSEPGKISKPKGDGR